MHRLLETQKLNSFATKALDKASAEELRQSYTEATVDPDRQEVVNDWSSIEGQEWSE